MPQRDLFDTIRVFEGSLGKWQSDIAGVKLDSPHAKAAEIHIKHSQDWIRSILDRPDYVITAKGADAVAKLESAMTVLRNSRPGTRQGLVKAGGAIDDALQGTYAAVRISVGKGVKGGGFTLDQPPSYEKTLSFLPGDTDYPTDVSSSEGSAAPSDTDHSAKVSGKR
jgi:hypothetical protein